MNRTELEQMVTRMVRALAEEKAGHLWKLAGFSMKDVEPVTTGKVRDLLRKAHIYGFAKADHTVDAVVFGLDMDEKTLKILLIERGRKGEPYYGMWALPGGFIESKEDLKRALRRELREETGFDLRTATTMYLEQLYTFGKPNRDPRGRVISTAYLALVKPTGVKGADDAAQAAWWDVNRLPELAFDHDKIIETGLNRLRSKVRWQPVGIELLPLEFTLTQLQRVYEIILDRSLDKRNFRRKVFKFGVLEEAGGTVHESHRPAKLYRFDRKQYQALLADGIDFEV
jgi:8-oxo-dGTP diphosphatase